MIIASRRSIAWRALQGKAMAKANAHCPHCRAPNPLVTTAEGVHHMASIRDAPSATVSPSVTCGRIRLCEKMGGGSERQYRKNL